MNYAKILKCSKTLGPHRRQTKVGEYRSPRRVTNPPNQNSHLTGSTNLSARRLINM